MNLVVDIWYINNTNMLVLVSFETCSLEVHWNLHLYDWGTYPFSLISPHHMARGYRVSESVIEESPSFLQNFHLTTTKKKT